MDTSPAAPRSLHTRPIYLDCHATTPVDPRVLEVMLPYFTEKFGNAASVNHAYGWQAAEAIEQAREKVATLLRTSHRSLIFTSGATEANNLALKGVLRRSPAGSHLIVSATEHRAVLDPSKRLEREGYALTVLPVDREGRIEPQQIADALRPETVLVSVMFANNEVGTIQPVAEIGEICRRRNVLFHCDAAQAVGRIPVELDRLPIDLLSVTAHKLYGPQGIGALFIRRDSAPVRIAPLFDGGGHEQGLRSGTLPLPLIVGFGAACALAHRLLADEAQRIAVLRDRLWGGLQKRLTDLSCNGHPSERLPGNLNISVDGVDGEALMRSLTEIAVSSGSACTSTDPEPSHVLRAMGVNERLSKASVRFGLGRFTTADDIDFAIDYVADVVSKLHRREPPV